MDLIERIGKYRTLAYELYQSGNIQELERLIDKMKTQIVEREYFLDAIDEGIDQVIAEREEQNKPSEYKLQDSHIPDDYLNNKSPEMEDEEVSKEYKDLFNLGYVLASNRGHDYEVAIKMLEGSAPNFKEAMPFRAMEAGRKQAEKDLEKQLVEQHRENVKLNHLTNRDDIITKDESYHDVEAKKEELGRLTDTEDIKGPLSDEEFQKEFGRPRIPALEPSENFIKQHNKDLEWVEGSDERKAFKEGTRDLLIEGNQNSEFVENGEPQSFGQETDEEIAKRRIAEKEALARDRDRSR